MIYISRYKNFRLGIRPTIKEHVHTGSGGQEVITHKGVTVEFQNAVFDTKNWKQYNRPESPDRINTIQSEQDLIRLMEESPFFTIDFFRREVQTREQRAAELRKQLAQLEAEESAENPSDAPEMEPVSTDLEDTPKPTVSQRRRLAASKTKPKSRSKNSKVDL